VAKQKKPLAINTKPAKRTREQYNATRKLKAMAKTVGKKAVKTVTKTTLSGRLAPVSLKRSIGLRRARTLLKPVSRKPVVSKILSASKTAGSTHVGSDPRFRGHFAQNLKRLRGAKGRSFTKEVHSRVARRALAHTGSTWSHRHGDLVFTHKLRGAVKKAEV
jgi:hypothetical protein